MIRRIVSMITPAVLLSGMMAAQAPATPEATVCTLEGSGQLSPGVTIVPQNFSVTIELDASCDSADPAFNIGTVTGSGSGFGGCAFSQLTGIATIDWGAGNVSQMTWVAVGAARVIHVDGTFVAGPFEGRHLRVVGLTGASNPAACAGSGVTEVTFTEAGVIA